MVSQNPKFRKVTQEEAVKILEDCHKAGFYQVAYFEKPASERFNAICNYCKCCCMGTRSRHLMGTQDNPFLAPSGYVAKVSNNFNGCVECVNYYPFSAISDEQEQKAVINQLA